MDLDTHTVTSFVLGVVLGFVLLSASIPMLSKRRRERFQSTIEEYERAIADLHQEQAEDRETNRRLRHELAVSTPEHLVETREELDQVNAKAAMLQAELDQVVEQLAERDRSLREARLAIQEIRLQLEGSGGRRGPGFDDLPPALADGSVGDS